MEDIGLVPLWRILHKDVLRWLRGLMTMAPIVEDPEEVRPLYARLRELARTLSRDLSEGSMSELSMGMTQDFEVAVEEGATMVRIGSALLA